MTFINSIQQREDKIAQMTNEDVKEKDQCAFYLNDAIEKNELETI